MAKKLFSDTDFDKQLKLGDEFVFDKPELNKLRVELVWRGTDLDLTAIMLGEDGVIHDVADLVYFNSKLRWKTAKSFSDPDFNPLDGQPSTWDKDGGNYPNPRKWMADTLPLSADASVIGSWDAIGKEDDEEDQGERMHVLLDEVNTKKYATIVFAAVVAKDRIAKGETFADAHDPVASVYNAETDELLCEYKLADQFPGKDAVCFGKMVYDAKEMMWQFAPMADAYKGGLMYLANEVFQ